MITDGIFSIGDKIPSIRAGSQSSGLSRTTVESAYAQLCAEGYIVSKAQSGFYVSYKRFGQAQENSVNKTPQGFDTEPEIKYDLISASADRNSFNFSLWRRYVKSALRQDERLLSYGEPQGEADLRKEICTYIAKERNVVCSPDSIVIAAGTQSLIGILCALTQNRKKVAFVGSYFDRGKIVFEDYGKTVTAMLPVPENIADLSSIDASIIYTSPSHIDSWGGVLSVGKRFQMLELAREKGFMIVEDDYDSEFRYYSRPMPSLQGMDAGQNVVYIGSFSKMLLPSIRISFMVLPPSLLSEYKKRCLMYNQTASKAEQIALCHYIRDGHLLSQIRKQRKQFAIKTKYICKIATDILPKDIEFSECHSSYLIRVKIKTEKTPQQIAHDAENHGIKLRPVAKKNNKAMLLISIAGFDVKNCEDMLTRLARLEI